MNRAEPLIIEIESDEDDINRNDRARDYGNKNSTHNNSRNRNVNKVESSRNDSKETGVNKNNDKGNRDDSDSDFCEIDEGRSAPRLNPSPGPRIFAVVGPAGPVVSFSRQPSMRQPPDRPPAPASALSSQPRYVPSRESRRPDSQSGLTQPSWRVNSNTKSISPRRSIRASPAQTAQLNVPRSRLQIVRRHRHVDIRESRRCTNCAADGRCCDGEAPCAFCFDPGFTCVYPGEEPVVSLQRSAPNTSEAVQDLPMTSSDEWTAEYDREQLLNTNQGYRNSTSSSSKASLDNSSGASQASNDNANSTTMIPQPSRSDTLDTEVQNLHNADIHDQGLGKNKNDPEATQMELDEQNDDQSDTTNDGSIDSSPAEAVNLSQLESVPATSWLPDKLEDVQNLIRIHEANINSHREYVVEAQLANAKLTSKRNIHIETGKRGVNPFKKMVAAHTRPALSAPPSTTLNMKVKARRSDYTNLKVAVDVLGKDKAAHIPEYKSIGRLRSIFLARNVHGLKFVPYNSGIEEKDLDQRRKDLETRFKDHSSEEFRRQRECLESVYQWSDDFDQILDELHISPTHFWKWLIRSNLTRCQKCETSCGSSPIYVPGLEPTKTAKQRYQWLYEAMTKTTQIGVWHFLSPRPGQIEKKSPARQDAKNVYQERQNLLCSLCFTHNCLTHGSFIDKEIELGETVVINDPEQKNNERQKTVLKVPKSRVPLHTCGIYCLTNPWDTDGVYDTRLIIGLDENGQLTGLRNKSVSMLTELGPFRGIEPCGRDCSLQKANRKVMKTTEYLLNWDRIDTAKQKLIVSLSKLYGSHLRLPCMISKIAGIECVQAFYALQQILIVTHDETNKDAMPNTIETMEARKMSAKAAGYNTGKSSLLEDRVTWVPCLHEGPCLSTHSDCACAREQVHCETACGCADNCRRRFRGCRCKKACFLDDRCECYAANRECDPMLCHDCGVEEVLDPSNKYRDDIRRGRCRNNRLQLDLPPRTVKGMSEVQGWGLFLGEDLPANSFIGEYKGENISATESDRRGAIYAYVSQEYLFNLNKDNQLDGSRFGNKTRFINNSKAKEFINVFPKVMFVNGVTRIGLFTNRAIKAGEELLYDYGYPAELVKGEFWEKHERAVEHNGVVTPIAKPKFRPRMAKNAVDTPGQEEEEDEDDDDDDEPIPMRKNARSPLKGKRKRRMEEILADSEEEDDKPTLQASAQEATDSSEYEENEEVEEPSTEEGTTSHESGVEEVDESEDELSIRTRRVVPGRVDRRRGGEAQRRAARTRKLNRLRGKQSTSRARV